MKLTELLAQEHTLTLQSFTNQEALRAGQYVIERALQEQLSRRRRTEAKRTTLVLRSTRRNGTGSGRVDPPEIERRAPARSQFALHASLQ